MLSSVRLSTAAALLLLPFSIASAQVQDLPLAGKALAAELRRGGYVLIFRHAATDWSSRDESRSRLEDCTTQRNLSDAGRTDARRVGEAIRALRIPIGIVTTSPYCRTRETAELAFGRADLSPDLLWPGSGASAAVMSEHRAQVDTRLGMVPALGQNTVLVSHGFVIQAATRHNVAEGEAVVIRPEGERKFTVVARVLPSAWEGLEGGR